MPTKVAIVDDNATIRGLVRAFIESQTDWEVSEAADAQDAISLAERLKPDLVVLDFLMPGKNGLDAARDIANICPTSAMVLFTAHANNELAAEAKRVGMQAVIAKGSDRCLEQLMTALRAASKSRLAA